MPGFYVYEYGEIFMIYRIWKQLIAIILASLVIGLVGCGNPFAIPSHGKKNLTQKQEVKLSDGESVGPEEGKE